MRTRETEEDEVKGFKRYRNKFRRHRRSFAEA
jgi:hypothetical protein